MRSFENNRGGNRRPNGSGGNRNFGKPGGRGPAGNMYPATCSDCGNKCEVPFKPSFGKTVLCNRCFKKNDGDDGYNRSDRFERGGNRNFGKKSLAARRLKSEKCSKPHAMNATKRARSLSVPTAISPCYAVIVLMKAKGVATTTKARLHQSQMKTKRHLPI
ncbi:hypothetical protein IPJ72_02130 [Candidatus Peregrinibacteria bacterium]|nr:MAG: hypothetical protein IPJ72_02130 [Candidatus Peregrinibacteria bacterium]